MHFDKRVVIKSRTATPADRHSLAPRAGDGEGSASPSRASVDREPWSGESLFVPGAGRVATLRGAASVDSRAPSPAQPLKPSSRPSDITALAEEYLKGHLSIRQAQRARAVFGNVTHLDLSGFDLPEDSRNLRRGQINDLLRCFSRLEYLRISLGLSDADIRGLPFKDLELSGLTRLDLSHNCLTDECINSTEAVNKGFELFYVRNLTHLNLSFNRLGEKACRYLEIECLPRLAELSLAGNPVAAGTLHNLRLASVPDLRTLDVSYTHVTRQEAAMLYAQQVATMGDGQAPRLQAIWVEDGVCVKPATTARTDAQR